MMFIFCLEEKFWGLDTGYTYRPGLPIDSSESFNYILMTIFLCNSALIPSEVIQSHHIILGSLTSGNYDNGKFGWLNNLQLGKNLASNPCFVNYLCHCLALQWGRCRSNSIFLTIVQSDFLREIIFLCIAPSSPFFLKQWAFFNMSKEVFWKVGLLKGTTFQWNMPI